MAKQQQTRSKRIAPIARKVGTFTVNDVKSLLKQIEATQGSIDAIEMRLAGGVSTWQSGAREGKERIIRKQQLLIEEAENLVKARKARLVLMIQRLKDLKALLVELKKALTRAGSKKTGPKSLTNLMDDIDDLDKIAKVLGIAS